MLGTLLTQVALLGCRVLVAFQVQRSWSLSVVDRRTKEMPADDPSQLMLMEDYKVILTLATRLTV
jgi:hypothetical protein